MISQPELVGQVVLYTNGAFQRLRRYYRGMHPKLGVLHRGLTGWETVQEIDVIKATKTFYSQERRCE